MRRSKFRMNDAQARGDPIRDDGAETDNDPADSAPPFAPASAGTASANTASASTDAPETDIVEDISELQRDLTLERDKLLRLAAEFDNYRKRMMRERLEAETRGKADLVKDILEPMDDIARFAHVDPAVTDLTTLVEGVAMVERKLEKILLAAGLEVVNPIDQPFDPARHEAVGTEPAEAPEEDGTVGRVYQLGYTFKGQLLRPARVVVRQYMRAH